MNHFFNKLLLVLSCMAGWANFAVAQGDTKLVQGIYRSAIVPDTAKFNNTTFNGTQDFFEAEFKREADFGGSVFNGETYFSSTKFDKLAYFYKTTFKKDVLFGSTIFSGPAYFNSAHFEKNVRFSEARFAGLVNFSNIALSDSGRMGFYKTVLPDTIIFTGVKDVKNDIDFSGANFTDPARFDTVSDKYREGKWHYINFYKSDISKFHIDYFHFRVLLLDENNLKLPTDESKSVYEALLKNFKDRGQNDSHDLLDIEYNDFMYGKHSIKHLWNCYGYHKEWVFYWAIALIVAFSIINFFCFEYLISTVYYFDFFGDARLLPPGNIEERMAKYKPELSHFWNRLWYSLSYTIIIFFLFSLKIENYNFNVLHRRKRDKAKHIIGLMYVVFIYGTGVACLAYMVNFVLQK